MCVCRELLRVPSFRPFGRRGPCRPPPSLGCVRGGPGPGNARRPSDEGCTHVWGRVVRMCRRGGTRQGNDSLIRYIHTGFVCVSGRQCVRSGIFLCV